MAQLAEALSYSPKVAFNYGSLTLGSTQPLTEINTSDVSWGVKAAGA